MIKKEWVHLSPEEREEYINQDRVGQKELSFSMINGRDLREKFYSYEISNERSVFGDTNKTYVTIIYEMYFLDNRLPREISYHIPYSERQIQYIIKDFKDKIKETGNTKIKLRILKEHFINRIQIKNIPKKFKVDKGHIIRTVNEHIFLIKSIRRTK